MLDTSKRGVSRNITVYKTYQGDNVCIENQIRNPLIQSKIHDNPNTKEPEFSFLTVTLMKLY